MRDSNSRPPSYEVCALPLSLNRGSSFLKVPGEGHGHDEGRWHVDLPDEVSQGPLKEQIQNELQMKIRPLTSSFCEFKSPDKPSLLFLLLLL